MVQNNSNFKVDILAIGVHPDDIELGCSGTLLQQIDLSYRVGLLDLTKGELGTRGNAELRTSEAFQAAEMMKAIFRTQLDLPDGFFEINESSIREIIKVIRDCQPTIVLANALSDRHPDHGRAAKLIQDACFYSSLAKIETRNGNGEQQNRWSPQIILHYIQDHQLTPDIVIDITDYMERKIELISCFSSQFYNPASTELSSAISSADFKDYIKSKSKIFGRPIQAEFAEGFQVVRPIGVRDLHHIL